MNHICPSTIATATNPILPTHPCDVPSPVAGTLTVPIHVGTFTAAPYGGIGPQPGNSFINFGAHCEKCGKCRNCGATL